MMTLWNALNVRMKRRKKLSRESKVSDADGGVKTLRLAVRVAAQTHSMFQNLKRVSEHWGTFLKIILN